MINSFTKVPNYVLDLCLPSINASELKIFLLIIRQTYGWKDKRTGQRKVRDRISNTQFQSKCGLSKRIVTKSIQSLSDKGLIIISDFKNNPLHYPSERKGKSYLFYAVHSEASGNAQKLPASVQNMSHNKRKKSKENITKKGARSFSGHISKLVTDKYPTLTE